MSYLSGALPLYFGMLAGAQESLKEQNKQGHAETAETASTRALLDQLFSQSRLYTQSKGYKELLDFVARLPNFAPFNAMLLQIQKPGLSFAASAHDWESLFERKPKPYARPLLILWPFGPVALVTMNRTQPGKTFSKRRPELLCSGLHWRAGDKAVSIFDGRPECVLEFHSCWDEDSGFHSGDCGPCEAWGG